MFTLQVQNMMAGLLQAGMPQEQVVVLGQVLGNCAQALEHNGPVEFNGPVSFTGPVTSTQPITVGGGSSSAVTNQNTVDQLNNLTQGDVNGLSTFINNVMVAITNNQININVTVIIAFITFLLSLVLKQKTFLTNYQYDTGTHKFQKKTQTAFVFNPGAESAWTDVYTAVGVVDVTNVQYTGGSHRLEQIKTNTDRYVLEAGTTATSTVLQMVLITPALDMTWSAPTLGYDQYAGVYVPEAGNTSFNVANVADAATCT